MCAHIYARYHLRLLTQCVEWDLALGASERLLQRVEPISTGGNARPAQMGEHPTESQGAWIFKHARDLEDQENPRNHYRKQATRNT